MVSSIRETSIQQLQECAKEIGGYVSITHYKKSRRKPSYNMIIREFSTWNGALQASGVMTRDEYINFCRDSLAGFFSSYSHNPTEQNYIRFQQTAPQTYPTIEQLHLCLGSWKTVLKETGFWVKALEAYSKELCQRWICQCAEGNQGVTTGEVYKTFYHKTIQEHPEEVIPSYEVIVGVYGTWASAVKDSQVKRFKAKIMLDMIQQQRAAKEFHQKTHEINNPYIRKK